MKTFLFTTFMVLSFLQLGAPLLAQKIKKRFQQLGTTMSSRPGFAMFNISNFWSEAAKLQKTADDPAIRQLLFIYYGWWMAALTVFAFIVAVGLPHP